MLQKNKDPSTLVMQSTITNAQAKELNSMRARIKSQGGPRRRYLNQRQNLYNLMASGLKRKQPDPLLLSSQ